MKRLMLVSLSSMAALILTAPLPASAQEPATATPAVLTAQPPANPLTPDAPGLRIVAEADSKEPVVSMDFNETPLADVIKAFRDATGANIISGGTNLQGAVSVRLDNVPWRKGLASILDLQGMQLSEQPAGSEIFVVEEKPTVEIPKIIKTFGLEYAKAEDIASLFSNILARTSRATPYKEANAVIVAATEQELGECENILKTIDKMAPQVYIEVRFVELTSAASKQLGVKWDALKSWGAEVHDIKGGIEYNDGELLTPRLNTVDFQNVNGVDVAVKQLLTPPVYPGAPGAGRTDEDMMWKSARGIGGQLTVSGFALAMSAFEQLDGASVFSNPKIIVANEKEALVDMTTKEPNLTVTTTRSGVSSDQIDIAAKLELIPGAPGDRDGKGKGLFAGEAFFSYGIVVKVTPRINPSGLITVNVEPSISERTGYYDFGTSTDAPTPKYPIIYMQRLQTVFTMQNGATAVIGGLTKTTEGNTDSGIPGLRNLPWIGPRLFGWKSRGKEQKEIIIFVTVGIADPLNLPKDIGLPKNAILGRAFISGESKEPGDRTTEDVMSLSGEVMQQDRSDTAAPAAIAPETAEPVTSEREALAQPKDEPVAKPKEEPITPLLKDN